MQAPLYRILQAFKDRRNTELKKNTLELVALADDVTSPCGGKYARLANGITKAEKLL